MRVVVVVGDKVRWFCRVWSHSCCPVGLCSRTFPQDDNEDEKLAMASYDEVYQDGAHPCRARDVVQRNFWGGVQCGLHVVPGLYERLAKIP